MKIDRKEWLSSKEAASYLGISVGSLMNLTSRNEIPFHKLGRRNRFLITELREFLLDPKRRNNQQELIIMKKLEVKPPEIKTMSAKEAWEEAVKKAEYSLGTQGHRFGEVGWKNPEDGKLTGPFLVTVDGEVAVEVDRFGFFQDAFASDADSYFPWVVAG